MKKLSLLFSVLFISFSFGQTKENETTVKKPSTVKEDNIYDYDMLYSTEGVEVKPEFPGGITKFYAFVAKNYKMPEEKGLKGKVYVTFVVEKDGSLTDIKILRDIGYGTGKETIRVLQLSPKWIPGVHNGRKVRCLYTLPITLVSPD
ncbi:MAG: energy transducer TonB [Bacteroidota bacterium]